MCPGPAIRATPKIFLRSAVWRAPSDAVLREGYAPGTRPSDIINPVYNRQIEGIEDVFERTHGNGLQGRFIPHPLPQ